MTEIETVESAYEAIGKYIAEGLHQWKQAGQLIVKLLDEDKKSIHEIAEQVGLDATLLARFEAIGRRQLVPEVLMRNSPGGRRLAMLPYSDQERYLKEPVPLLIDNTGKWETLAVPVDNLTSEQAKQVFGRDGYRDDGQQRAYVETKREKEITKLKAATHTNPPYEIRKGEVIFTDKCTLNAKDLAMLLSRIS